MSQEELMKYLKSPDEWMKYPVDARYRGYQEYQDCLKVNRKNKEKSTLCISEKSEEVEESRPKRSLAEISGEINRLYKEYDEVVKYEKRRKTETESKEWQEHKACVREWCETLMAEMPSLRRQGSF